MTEGKIYLEMPQEYKTKWLEALRSGEYTQGKGHLCTFEDGNNDELPRDASEQPVGFCCLGVLVDVLSGREGLLSGEWSDDDNTVPSYLWYKEHGMSSFPVQHEELNLTNMPMPASKGSRADCLLTTKNDGCTKYNGVNYQNGVAVPSQSFLEIADWIEANVKGV